MAVLQPIINIAEICARHGIENVILSPGSRCAPLTIAFTRHNKINCKTVSDERSAAFIGLGMAQFTANPSVLVCTSGSAAYNYAPAVAEAYYQQVPLLVLTADRPDEWIDQLDGQTIRQKGIYGQHVKGDYALPVDYNHPDAEWHVYRTISEAINLAKAYPPGPVHVNVPLREPFYPDENEKIVFDENIPVFNEIPTECNLSAVDLESIKKTWMASHHKLIAGGQSQPVEALNQHLYAISKEGRVPVLGDVISNLHANDSTIRHHDVFLGINKKGFHESLQPDLLVTFGKSTISKNLKLFLRKHKPKIHWHVQLSGEVADTYQSLSKVIRTTPEYFFAMLNDNKHDKGFEEQKQENYYQLWEIEERKVLRSFDNLPKTKVIYELQVYHNIVQAVPDGTQLHLANSMAVRYANIIGLSPNQKAITVFANRGTSGIDGSNSTALGSALVSGKPTLLLTGDMAFLYDRNAFWHNYNYQYLKIVVFNNGGGGIFNMISGPSDLEEYKEYFETDQRLTAKPIADEFGMEYIICDTPRKLANSIAHFFEITDKPAILEIKTDSITNKEVLNEFKQMQK